MAADSGSIVTRENVNSLRTRTVIDGGLLSYYQSRLKMCSEGTGRSVAFPVAQGTFFLLMFVLIIRILFQ